MGPAITRREALATGLALGALGVAAPAEAGYEPRWVDQRAVGPFVCRATFPLRDRLFAEADLERLEAELIRVLALRPCRDEVELLIVNDARQHKRLIRARHPEAPYRRALYFQRKGRASIYAFRHAELATDLRHECTHALLHADLPMVPLWLDEGLAEYFEAPAHRRAEGPSHLEKLLSEVRRGRLVTLESLEAKRKLEELTERDYRHAWAWTHFLLHGPPAASGQLWATLAALRRFEPPGPLSERLRAVFPSPADALTAHFRAWPQVLQAAGRIGVAAG